MKTWNIVINTNKHKKEFIPEKEACIIEQKFKK